jgi:FkbM family methyltransferase
MSHGSRPINKLLALVGLVITTKKYFTHLQEFEINIFNKIEESLISATSAVLHIGAHIGQEADKYFQKGAKVHWIEGNPILFKILSNNILKYENQKATCAVLGNINIEEVNFNLASNSGLSSSLFQLSDISGFNSVSMIEKIKVPMYRLDTLFTKSEMAQYRHWVIDVQGAELLVLQGAGNLLDSVVSISIEVSTREVYKGGATWEEISNFLGTHGFVALWCPKLESHTNVLFIRLRNEHLGDD